jgi:hypothetical protein
MSAGDARWWEKLAMSVPLLLLAVVVWGWGLRLQRFLAIGVAILAVVTIVGDLCIVLTSHDSLHLTDGSQRHVPSGLWWTCLGLGLAYGLMGAIWPQLILYAAACQFLLYWTASVIVVLTLAAAGGCILHRLPLAMFVMLVMVSLVAGLLLGVLVSSKIPRGQGTMEMTSSPHPLAVLVALAAACSQQALSVLLAPVSWGSLIVQPFLGPATSQPTGLSWGNWVSLSISVASAILSFGYQCRQQLKSPSDAVAVKQPSPLTAA